MIDDLQWAEPVFVDLVEHIADLSRDAPIFLLCIARTGAARRSARLGRRQAQRDVAPPRAARRGECLELIGALSTAPLDDDSGADHGRVGGNPLYVEEMLAMVREHGATERSPCRRRSTRSSRRASTRSTATFAVVMERGSVEGEVFHRGAVAVSLPTVRDEVESHLTTLVRKELIRSTAPTFPDDEGFRFRHLLIRDAAYESLPKATRAELHERFADWLATHDLVEVDEIVGYHLEQAHRYRAELDPADSILTALAEARVEENLGLAGRGAFDRGDFNAGRSLLRRAVDLLPEDTDAVGTAPPPGVRASRGRCIRRAWELLDGALAASDRSTWAMRS